MLTMITMPTAETPFVLILRQGKNCQTTATQQKLHLPQGGLLAKLREVLLLHFMLWVLQSMALLLLVYVA
jgi:hypothetical protein